MDARFARRIGLETMSKVRNEVPARHGSLEHLAVGEPRGAVPLAAKLAALPDGEYGFSIVSFHEQVLGCNSFISAARTDAKIVRGYDLLLMVIRHFKGAHIVAFDVATQRTLSKLGSRKLRLSAFDSRIAATALTHNLTLLTRNTVGFERVPGLRIEDWTR